MCPFFFPSSISCSKKRYYLSLQTLPLDSTKIERYICPGTLKGQWEIDARSLERKRHFKNEKEPGLELLRNYILSHEKCHQKGIKIGSSFSKTPFLLECFYQKTKSFHQEAQAPQKTHVALKQTQVPYTDLLGLCSVTAA